jgi:hypothetical protein
MEMKYVEDPKLNERVAKVIEELKEEIVSRFRPKSIIITGSFGRGEAKVVEEGGKLKFLSDCEVILIPYKWIFSRKKLDEFEREFYERTGLKVEIWGFAPTIYLCIPFLNKRMKPLIVYYDLKYGSKVVYGKNYLEKIPSFKPADIPVWEGIRLLLNRMAEALEHFSTDSSYEMFFWCDKIVLACQDALLLTIGKYTPSYRERNRVFRGLIEQFDLSCIQTLADFAASATSRKLKRENFPSNSMEYWFQVSKICDEVLRYVLKKGYGIEFSDYVKFQEKYLKSELKNYTTLPFNNPVLQNLFRFAKKIILRYTLPTSKMLLKLRTRWSHLIYSHIPLLYFGVAEKLEVNTKYLDIIIDLLGKLGCNIEVKNRDFENWFEVKEVFVKIWHQLQL